MKRHPFWHQLRIFITLILISVVFVNLVLAQLKSYTPEFEMESWETLQQLVLLPDDNCSGLKLPANPSLTPSVLSTPKKPLSLWLGIGCSPKHPDYRVSRLIDANQWLIFSTIFIVTMLARLITSSWTVALIVCATLLSSTEPTQAISNIGVRNLFIFLFSSWFLCLVYYLRTGSQWTIAGMALTASVATYFGQLELVLACLAIPFAILSFAQIRWSLLRPMLKKIHAHNRQVRSSHPRIRPSENSLSGPPRPLLSALTSSILGYQTAAPAVQLHYPRKRGLLHAFDVPFIIWVFTNRSAARLAIRWVLGVLLLIGVAMIYFKEVAGSDFMHFSLNALLDQPISSDLVKSKITSGVSAFWQAINERQILCLILISFCLFIPPHRSVNSFFETSWCFVLAVALILVGSFFLAQFRPYDPGLKVIYFDYLISWFEPVLIAMGIASVFNIIRALDNIIYSRSY